MSEKAQSFENHAKYVPAYHFVATPILLAVFLWSGWRLITAFSVDTVISLLLAVALIIMHLFIRLFPLKVQDRLIRLEESMRLREVLPQGMHGDLHKIRYGQFVALRFAPDEELEGLVSKILAGDLKSGKEIKAAIKTWRPDQFRM